MANLKKVMTKEGKIKIIDSSKEKDWMVKYLHISGNNFEVTDEYLKSIKPKKKVTRKRKTVKND